MREDGYWLLVHLKIGRLWMQIGGYTSKDINRSNAMDEWKSDPDDQVHGRLQKKRKKKIDELNLQVRLVSQLGRLVLPT